MIPTASKSRRRLWTVTLVALVAGLVALAMLETARAGLRFDPVAVGTTPATHIHQTGARGPLVVIAHGFAGSRPLMQAYGVALARGGYHVLSFDFEGHGRNPVPMSGDVTSLDGTTALLIAETRRVLAEARARGLTEAGVALLGHSMATDILVRTAEAEARAGRPVDAIVAISMFSGAVTADFPEALLMISGQGEPALRAVALGNLRLLDPDAVEGDTVTANGLTRRAVVAPWVEHVGVLYSPTALRATRDWLDAVFGRDLWAGDYGSIIVPGVTMPGLWILALLGAVVALAYPLSRRLPRVASDAVPAPLTLRRFAWAVLVPALAVPLVLTALYRPFLPVLVADYLMLHLAAYGLVQLALTGGLARPRSGWRPTLAGSALLVLWGIGVFGLGMDRHVASFLPDAARLGVIAVLALGTVPFMIADARVTEAGRAGWGRRVVARVAVLASLAAAAVIDTERLMFLFLILPLMLVFYALHGLMGRWVGQRAGGWAAGIGLGLCLAWALGVSFPQFSAG